MTDRLQFISGLIGKPYEVGASGPEAFDCYGLSAYVQRECYGITMHGERPGAVDATSTIESLMAHPERRLWQQVNGFPTDGDLVVMANVKNQERHLGTYVVAGGVGAILHTNDKQVVFEDRNSLMMRGFSDIKFFRRKPE